MADKKKQMCMYGVNCYRRNPSHFLEFDHPAGVVHQKRKVEEKCDSFGELEGSSSQKQEKVGKKQRLEAGADGVEETTTGVRLSKVRGLSDQWNRGQLNLQDILMLNADKLVGSAQFNYMVDFDWLLAQYPQALRDKPLLIVTGDSGVDWARLRADCQKHPNVTLGKARLDIPYGTHHTKMMLLRYTDGIRVVVHTANLIENDWDLKTQGIYVSPLCPPCPDKAVGESRLSFRSDLIRYLSAYRLKCLDDWIQLIGGHDFRAVDVALVGSVPGRHTGLDKDSWGHLKLRRLLQSVENARVTQRWPIMAQFSSIGSLGPTPESWLLSEWLTSLGTSGKALGIAKKPPLHLVFPSVDDVRESLEGYPAGASLPYAIETARKQPYLRQFLHRWRSAHRGRTRASPHIKTYARVHPEGEEVAWFLLTSANLSKAAWGALEKKEAQLAIRSYELGVLLFANGDAPLSKEVLPVDFPLEKYSSDDEPWVWNIPYLQKPDTHGNIWQPS